MSIAKKVLFTGFSSLFTLTFFISLLVSFQLHSQNCTVDAFPAPATTITCGDCLQLSAFGNSGNLALDNDFDNGNVGSGWSSTTSATFTNPCGGGVNGTTYMWMGDASPQPRILETQAFDLSPGGSICFDMMFSTQADAAPCEGPDEPDEGVYLQYSTDGGNTWININYFDPLGGYDPQLTTWNNYCFPIPPGAMTPNTIIRWFQDATSGAEYDHWGLDNVQIILNDPNYYYIWLHNNFQGIEPPPVCPGSDSTFTVVYTDGSTDACTATVDVTVLPPELLSYAGADTAVCPGECVTLDADAEVILNPADQHTFENNEFQPFAPLGIPTEINVNVAGLNMNNIQPGSINSVCLDVTGDVSQLEVVLVCPDGTQLTLVPQGSATGNNFGGTCFTLGATQPISSGSAPYSGTYLPGGGGSLDDLAGCTANGVWTLQVTNNSFFPLGGFFNSWSITFDDPEVTQPAVYTWSPTTGLSDPNSLNPTVCPTQPVTYTLTVEDQQGCASTSSTVTISMDNNCCPMTIDNVATVDPTCGGNDGSITITQSGGANPVQYSIDNGTTFQASNTFNNLGAGTYDIVVEDGGGCQQFDQVTLSNSAAPSIDNVAPTNPSCGATDGAIDITASGGTAPLEYSIDNGTTFQASGSFNNLAGGTYDIIVEDASGCQATDQITLTAPNSPTIDNVNTTDPSCGASDGSIDITASGGTPPYQYSIDNGANFAQGSSFNNLSNGNYTILVEDANGCQATQQVSLSNSGGPAIDNVAAVEPNCGASDGTIDITASGGAPPLQYSIDNGTTFQANGSFVNLGSGTYDIVVEDANGCQANDQVVFNSVAAPSIDNLVSADPQCGANDGTIDITASGGTAPLQYSIDNGTSFQANGSFANLPDGTYDIIVEDASGCQATDQVVLNPSSSPVIDNVATTPPSCGSNDGSIDITASNGTAPLQYSIDNGSTYQGSGTFNNLGIGTYNIIVEDATGCQVTDQVNLNNLNGPSIDNLASTDPNCGGSDGTIDITASGGTAPLQYSIDNGNTFQGNGSFSNLSAGTYDITVEDAGGCQSSGQVVLNTTSAPTVDNVNGTDPSCGASDGSITITASGGSAPLQYSIDNGTTFQAAETFNNLGPATYDIVVQDASGCQVTDQYTLNNVNGPSIDDLSSADPFCGESNGSITFTASGGTAPLQYSINNGSNFQGNGQFSNLPEGTYSIVVEDDIGCQATDQIVLTNSPIPKIDQLITVRPTCGLNNAEITVDYSGGTPPIEFSIDSGATYVPDSVFTDLPPGNYPVIIQDANGCTDSETVTFAPSTAPVADFSFTPTSATIFDPLINFDNESSGAVSYEWYFGDVGTSTEADPSFEFPSDPPANYDVCLVAMNADYCADTICYLVAIEEGFTVYVPNAFTPNNNNLNDEFFPVVSGVEDYKLYIYDRWGGLIYSSNSAQHPWKGRTRDGSEYVAEGVYAWKFIVDDERAGQHEYVGHVTVIR